MQFIDTHTHIYGPSFKEHGYEAIQRAIGVGVETMMLPNIDLESIQNMHEISDLFPKHCFPMMGLHPCSVNEDFESILDKMKLHFKDRKYYGIGETGIDLYWDKTKLKQQKEAFKIQINWAKEMKLPLIIHARDAFNEIFEVLDQENDESLKGIFHCFTGNNDERIKIENYGGFLFGIGGVVTYKNSTLPEVVQNIPIEKILLETDSPYLPPVPFRGKPNESAYIPYIAEKLTDIYNISLHEIAKITTRNAQQIFNL
jgi:TatD DNase family protein